MTEGLLKICVCLFLTVSSHALADGERETLGRIASESETQTFLKNLAEHSQKTRTLHVRFCQEKKLRILRRPRRSTGQLAFSEGKLSIELRDKSGNVESRLLSKDGELRILYPALERLEVFPAERAGDTKEAGSGYNARVPLFTGNWARLSEDYRVTLTHPDTTGSERKDSERAKLTLVPKRSASPVKTIVIVFHEHRIQDYRQLEKSGNEVRIEVLEWKVNEKIPPKSFELEVPKNTRIVRVGGSRGRRNSEEARKPGKE